MKLLKKTISALLATAMVTTSFLSVSAVDNTQKEETATLPSSYSSVEHGYVTPVKDQGNTGTCWAYATIAACESSMIIHNGYDTTLDLSELHLVYSKEHAPNDKMGMFDCIPLYPEMYINTGATNVIAMMVLANQQGVVTESANHGQFDSSKLQFKYADKFTAYNLESSYAFNEAYVTDAYKVYVSNPDLVKKLILMYGAGVAQILTEFYNDKTSTYYCYDKSNEKTDHDIAIVGWDDNYPKEKCTVNGYTPENDGAWLIKNSWGEDKGINGYNWVSYEDCSINSDPVVFYKLSKSDIHTNTYQYDDLLEHTGNSFFIDESGNILFEGGAYMSNVFTSQKDNEILEAVSFYTDNENLDYTVEVYTGVEGNTDPTMGTLKATVSGEDLLIGYHTIELPEPVALTKGEKFSVVVNIKDNQDPLRGVYINIDCLQNIRKKSDYGESFVSEDGKNWDDIKYSVDGNMRIKAFTHSDEKPIELMDYYNSYNGKTREELMADLKTTLEKSNTALEHNFKYKIDYIYFDLRRYYDYTNQVYHNPDKFLALDLYSLKDKLDDCYTKLSPFYNSFENEIKYFDTMAEWQHFLNVYSEIIMKLKTEEMYVYDLNFYINQLDTAYEEYLLNISKKGAFDSYLQMYGDVDNSGDINITDATTIQMLAAKSTDFDFYKYYNSDVDGDGNITIKDATAVQMYISQLIKYMPVYDKQFGDEEVDKNIDFDTAVLNLETAVDNIKNSPYFEMLQHNTSSNLYLTLFCQYNDAKSVLEYADNYNPNVIAFKARCLNYNLRLVEQLPK